MSKCADHSNWHLAGCALIVQLGLTAWSAAHHSPTWDEPGHLVAGISHWEFGTFDLYRVNPPLVRLVAGGVACLLQPASNWRCYDATPGVRSERAIRRDFIADNGERVFVLHACARYACLPFLLLGGGVVYCWAKELYGCSAALLATLLWSVSPAMIAYGGLITPDVGAASLGVLSGYWFWKWLRSPGWRNALLAGTGLGLAELTKTTWILLFGLWPVIWVLWRLPSPQPRRVATRTGSFCDEPNSIHVSFLCQLLHVVVIMLVAVYFINAVYGFEGSFQRVRDYSFVSQTMRDIQAVARPPVAQGWFDEIRVPFPKNYVMGIDLQRRDFEDKMWSFLRGEWRKGGWYQYYLYAALIKIPLGTWVLVGAAIVVTIGCPRYSSTWRNEIVLILPILTVVALVSSQTGFNHHFRYVVPAIPYLFVWISKVAKSFEFRHRGLATLVVGSLCWTATSSFWIYPHSLSYFNELVGGPRHGHEHLLDSNIDWGQDLLYLQRWIERHPQARGLHLTFYGCYTPEMVGMDESSSSSVVPGYYAISVNELRARSRKNTRFLQVAPVATAGYSIYIYHITLDDANRLRCDLGLSAMPENAVRETITQNLRTIRRWQNRDHYNSGQRAERDSQLRASHAVRVLRTGNDGRSRAW